MKKLIFFALCACAYIGCSESRSFEEHGALSDEFPAVKESGPVHQSKNCVVESSVTNGEVELSVPLDTPEDAVMVVLGEESSSLKSAAKSIRGTSFDEPDLATMNLPSVGVNYSLASLKSGKHDMKLAGLKKSVFKAVISQPKSPLSLYLKLTPLAVKAGETVTVEATLSDEKNPSEAAVVAIYEGNIIVLKDDGVSPDTTANDGVYAGSFKAPEVDSFKNILVSVQASGKRYTGSAFARNSSASILVNPAGSDIDAGGIAATAEKIVVPVTAGSSFNARIDIIYGSGNSSVAWTKKELQLSEGGNEVTVSRSAESLPADKAVIRLLNADTRGLEDEVQIALTPCGTAKSSSSVSKAAVKDELPAGKRSAAEAYGD